MNQPIESTDLDVAFLGDVVAGLTQAQKTLSCKYLYDEVGSHLFDQICETDEYYLTRAELEIMETNADSIAYQIGKQAMLVEFGSGSSRKLEFVIPAS